MIVEINKKDLMKIKKERPTPFLIKLFGLFSLLFFSLFFVPSVTAALDTSLIGYYAFESNTSPYDDSSGNWYSMSASGTAQPVLTLGRVGNAFDFDGAVNQIDGNNIFQVISSTYSVQTWIKVENSTPISDQVIFSSSKSTNSDHQLKMELTTTGNIKCSSGIISVSSSNIVTDNQWQHIICVFKPGSGPLANDGEISLFLNTNEDDMIYTGYFDDAGTTMSVGRKSWATITPAYFDGVIDEFVIWNRDVSSDVISLYNGGVGVSYNTISATGYPTLVSGVECPDGVTCSLTYDEATEIFSFTWNDSSLQIDSGYIKFYELTSNGTEHKNTTTVIGASGTINFDASAYTGTKKIIAYLTDADATLFEEGDIIVGVLLEEEELVLSEGIPKMDSAFFSGLLILALMMVGVAFRSSVITLLMGGVGVIFVNMSFAPLGIAWSAMYLIMAVIIIIVLEKVRAE